MLFSPLTAETHATITGYGVPGTSASPNGAIDFRRRAAENMVSTLSSLNDRNDFLFGPPTGTNPQSLYQTDFDSPAGYTAFNTAARRFDFDLFGGPAREGTTAGGDSGGPLIVDQKYSRPVVAAVLSGGSRFFSAQASNSYGTSSFYQPLFLFWDQIVANNPYVYAGNKAGDGNWEDGSHWISLMDPNYMVDRGGVLVNDLPDTPALGVTGNTVKFGSVCFLGECEDLALDSEARPLPVGSGTGLYIAGGPGSTDFVPNNASANPKAGIKAHYYDVTLSAAGTTTLSSAVTIDALTLNGASKLSIGQAGALNVLGEINQVVGWTHVDGLLKSGSDMMFATGLLSGSGIVKAPFVTVAAAIVDQDRDAARDRQADDQRRHDPRFGLIAVHRCAARQVRSACSHCQWGEHGHPDPEPERHQRGQAVGGVQQGDGWSGAPRGRELCHRHSLRRRQRPVRECLYVSGRPTTGAFLRPK